MIRRATPWLLAISLAACSDPNGSNDAGADAPDVSAVDSATDGTPMDTGLVDAHDVVSPIDAPDVIDELPAVDAPDVAMADSGNDVTNDTSTSDAACMPATNDTSAIGNNCASGGSCPAGYTCQSMSGIVLQQRCEILCRASCECPGAYVCNTHTDKAGSWMQCDAP